MKKMSGENTFDGIILDMEMTGLNPRTEKIIEIGAGKIRYGELVETFSCFVNPGRKLNRQTTEITGITDEMLADSREFAEIMPAFLDFIGEDVLVGHNIIFDYSFLKKAVLNHMPKGTKFERKGIDTLKIARYFLPGSQKKTLIDLCGYYGIVYKPHRALNDALATWQLYEKLWEAYYKETPEIFASRPLIYQVKKESPIMPKQIEQIQRLISLYGVKCPYELSGMTKNEASRYVDELKRTCGHV